MTGRTWASTPNADLSYAFTPDGIFPLGVKPQQFKGSAMGSTLSDTSTRAGTTSGCNSEAVSGLNSFALGVGTSSEASVAWQGNLDALEPVDASFVSRMDTLSEAVGTLSSPMRDPSRAVHVSSTVDRLVNDVHKETAIVPKVVLRELAKQGILQVIPRDHKGQITSVGSLLHAKSACRPCSFWAGHQHCTYGIACTYCHFPHVGMEHRRLRPSKQMRVRLHRWQALQRKSATSNPLDEEDEELGPEGLNELLGVSLQALLPDLNLGSTAKPSGEQIEAAPGLSLPDVPPMQPVPTSSSFLWESTLQSKELQQSKPLSQRAIAAMHAELSELGQLPPLANTLPVQMSLPSLPSAPSRLEQMQAVDLFARASMPYSPQLPLSRDDGTEMRQKYREALVSSEQLRLAYAYTYGCPPVDDSSESVQVPVQRY
eukprot:CAMPEP_0178385578 /NCGR_PEP_ID=MMETSP0689_2-20121128/8103_1 /TAXON_ID=160604 /ORGANISM="Amphidinium massartii, Strain CS-259" /LENGTH=428 /DNA_ID=CAMNT_0020005861 /DNA_START=18 /DNA_END=1301 /DNA_ORIENTATION=+